MSGAVEGVDMIEFAARVLWADGQRRLKQGQSDLPRTRTDFRAAASALFSHPALASLTTPPARSYADGVEDAAKVADDLASIAERGKLHPQPLVIDTNEAWRRVEDACRDIAAAIRLLSQGGKA